MEEQDNIIELQSSFTEYIDTVKLLPLNEKKQEVIDSIKGLIANIDMIAQTDNKELHYLKSEEINDISKEPVSDDDYVEALLVYIEVAKNMLGEYLLYKENNIEIPKNIAGLMMAGIISDTLLLSSPTTTEVDRETLEELSKIAGVDKEKFGMEMFKAGSSMEGKSINDIIFMDFKNFDVNGMKIGIGQVSTMNTDEIMGKQEEFIEEINQITKTQGFTAVSLFVTDILKNGSYILFNKDAKEIFAKSFGLDTISQGHFFDGLVSRKKQVMPKIMNHLENK